MKRLLSILLSVLMVLSIGLTAVYAEDVTLPFTDVKKTWYYDAVVYVYTNGLMNGKTETTFAPEVELTRAEFAKMLWSLAGSPETKADLKFADTKNNKWYAESLTWAVNAGIVNGYSEGGKSLFKPDNQIFRDELAKMIVTFLEYMDVEIVGDEIADSFPDASSFQKWAKPYIEAVRLSGLMKGKSAGKFQPKETAKRSEGATILMRMHPALATPAYAMEKLVTEFLEKALCGTHGQVEFYGYFNSSITAENIVNAYVEAMDLDTDVYTLTVTQESVDALKGGYEGCGNGDSAGGDLDFVLTHKESGETYEFSTHVYATKYIGGEIDGELRGFAANPPFIPFACPDDYSSLKSEPVAKATIETLKGTANVYEFTENSDFNKDNIWAAVNDAIKLDKSQFNLALLVEELDAVVAQAPTSGYKEITADLTVIVRSTCKQVEAARDTVSVTFKVGYNDPNPGICDIETEANEVLPGSVKLDGVLSDSEYTFVDTYLDEIELRDKTSGNATDELNAMLNSAKVGFSWDPVNGLHIAAQWQDTNRHQTSGKDTTGDGMLFSGTSLNLFVTDSNSSNGNTVIYYGIGKNTENGEYAAGSYSGQAGVGDILLGSKAPAPNVDYVISYGDDNMVTVEWTVPADALAADGIKAGDKLYLSLTMLGQKDDGFYAISFGNGGCFKESTAKTQMTVTLKGDDAAYKAEEERMQAVIDKFLASTECIHGSYNFMFTFGSSVSESSVLQVVSETINNYATELLRENVKPALQKMTYSTEYYVTFDGSASECGYQSVKNSFGDIGWAGGAGGTIEFILHSTKSDVVVPFSFNVNFVKAYSLIDYSYGGGDYSELSRANENGIYCDGLGVDANPVYVPQYCNDNYGTMKLDKWANESVYPALDAYKDDNGTIVVPTNDLAGLTAKESSSYGKIWHAVNELLDYNFPEYYMVLCDSDVKNLIDNGGEGKLRIKITPVCSYPEFDKGSFVEYNFKFVQNDVETIVENWKMDAFCGVHGQVEMYANYGSSWGETQNLIDAVVADMGINTATHKLEVVTRTYNYQNNGCGNHSGDSDDATFKLTEIAIGASEEFDVHFSIMKYYDQTSTDAIVNAGDTTVDIRQFPVTVRHNCPDDQNQYVAEPEMFNILQGLLSKTDANGYLTVDLGGDINCHKLAEKLEEFIAIDYNENNYFLEYKVDSALREAATYGKGLLTVGVHHCSKTEWTFYVTIPVILK